MRCRRGVEALGAFQQLRCLFARPGPTTRSRRRDRGGLLHQAALPRTWRVAALGNVERVQQVVRRRLTKPLAHVRRAPPRGHGLQWRGGGHGHMQYSTLPRGRRLEHLGIVRCLPNDVRPQHKDPVAEVHESRPCRWRRTLRWPRREWRGIRAPGVRRAAPVPYSRHLAGLGRLVAVLHYV